MQKRLEKRVAIEAAISLAAVDLGTAGGSTIVLEAATADNV